MAAARKKGFKLLVMGNNFSYTTGTYAAAAAKAALSILLGGKVPAEIEQILPNGETAKVTVNRIERNGKYVKCGVVKKSVEETDVTHNLEIFARVSLREDDKITIDGGEGIGRITKKGLQLPQGEAAINPVPRKMIHDSVRELTRRGVDVVISAPKGEEVASTTYNSRLGIIGGISIIGTTGIMRAKSLDSFKETILLELNFCKENNAAEIVITPGNIGEEAMLKHFGDRVDRERGGGPRYGVVQSGDFLGFTLRHAHAMGLGLILAGHPGKLAKVLTGHFQTHYSKSPPANDVVIGLLKGSVSSVALKEMKESPTVEGITTVLARHCKGELMCGVAGVIEDKVKKYLKTSSPIPVLLFNMSKELIGSSASGSKWIRGSL